MEVNKKQLAQIIGITERSLSRFVDEGLPIEKKGKKGQPHVYDTAKVVQWLLERERSRTTEDKLDLNTERAKLARAQTEKTEMENRVRAGELIQADSLNLELASYLTTIKDGFYVLLDRFADLTDIEGQKKSRRLLDSLIININDGYSRFIEQHLKNCEPYDTDHPEDAFVQICPWGSDCDFDSPTMIDLANDVEKVIREAGHHKLVREVNAILMEPVWEMLDGKSEVSNRRGPGKGNGRKKSSRNGARRVRN